MSCERNGAAPVDVSVILVNWNSEDDLCQCIRSIQRTTRAASYEIIVVDNASPAKRVPELKKEFPGVRFVESPANVGFSRANNLGFQQSSGECILFLNPDTKQLAPAIDILYAALKQLPHAGAVGGKLLNADLSVQTSTIQKFPTIWNQLLDVEYLRLRWPRYPLWGIGPLFSDKSDPVAVEMISGAAVMLRRETFEQVGMFSEDYFMYAEDLDLCYRLRQAGFTNYYIPQAVMIHYGGTSSGKQQFRHWPTVMKYRALFHFQQKHRGAFYSLFFRASIALSALCRLGLLGLLRPFRSSASRERLRSALMKWTTVWKCAIGIWKECPQAAKPGAVITSPLNNGNCGQRA